MTLLAVSSVDAAELLATENTAAPKGLGETSRNVNIYRIDTNTCTASLVGSRPEIVLPEVNSGDLATDNFNGNALEPRSCRLYYTRFDRNSDDLVGDDPNPLFFDDLSGGVSTAGTLQGGGAGGAFWNGAYYYVQQLSARLQRVFFDATGAIVGEELLCELPLGDDVLGFGDLSFDPLDGTLYGSATRIGSQLTPQFFSVTDLDCNTYDVISTDDPFGAGAMQLAFGLSDGMLHGHAAGTGEWFTIDKSDGTQAPLCDPMVKDEDHGGIDPNILKLSDLAGGECLPTLSITGVCPGAITIRVAGATAGESVALAFSSSEGASNVPGGSCAGTPLGLDGPGLLTIVPADAGGELSIDRTAPAGACGLFLQGVDTSTCSTTNVARVPDGS